MSDAESEYGEYSDIESVYSEFSDTVHEDIDVKNILKQKFMNYKCKDCEMLKLTIQQGFIDGVSNNICQYMICNNCNRIINKIDYMNNRDFDNRNAETLDDDLEIFVFIEMNKFFTEKEFDNALDNGYVNGFIYKYYSLVKRLYNMSFSIKRLKYEALNDNDFDFVNEFLNCKYEAHELRYTARHAIRVMKVFINEIGNDMYNEKTVDKLVKRIEREF